MEGASRRKSFIFNSTNWVLPKCPLKLIWSSFAANLQSLSNFSFVTSCYDVACSSFVQGDTLPFHPRNYHGKLLVRQEVVAGCSSTYCLNLPSLQYREKAEKEPPQASKNHPDSLSRFFWRFFWMSCTQDLEEPAKKELANRLIAYMNRPCYEWNWLVKWANGSNQSLQHSQQVLRGQVLAIYASVFSVTNEVVVNFFLKGNLYQDYCLTRLKGQFFILRTHRVARTTPVVRIRSWPLEDSCLSQSSRDRT